MVDPFRTGMFNFHYSLQNNNHTRLSVTFFFLEIGCKEKFVHGKLQAVTYARNPMYVSNYRRVDPYEGRPLTFRKVPKILSLFTEMGSTENEFSEYNCCTLWYIDECLRKGYGSISPKTVSRNIRSVTGFDERRTSSER
ncbi:hypothetical protein TNCV_516561 [Trichonephila clavipes]|nr:hypothetical protein TNCV_516561 [Trichonephila clavipes]